MYIKRLVRREIKTKYGIPEWAKGSLEVGSFVLRPFPNYDCVIHTQSVWMPRTVYSLSSCRHNHEDKCCNDQRRSESVTMAEADRSLGENLEWKNESEWRLICFDSRVSGHPPAYWT